MPEEEMILSDIISVEELRSILVEMDTFSDDKVQADCEARKEEWLPYMQMLAEFRATTGAPLPKVVTSSMMVLLIALSRALHKYDNQRIM